MRSLLVLAIASCSLEPPRAAPIEAGPACEVDPRDLTSSPVIVDSRAAIGAETTPAVPRPVTTGGHGLSIAVVAATEDGTVAVTADAAGAVRVWPALDGTREPVVVAARPPLALAVARAAGELVIAGLDATGQLEVIRITAAAAPVGRAVVDAPRPYRAVRALPTAILAVRDDQQIDRVDARAAIVGSLVPEPGSRVGAIAVRRGKALAVLASSEGVRGRWLELADGFAWGDATPELPIDPALAELSPDLRHLMAVHARSDRAATIDLVTGRAYAIPGDDADSQVSMRPLGFPSADVLAMTTTVDRGVMWRSGHATRRGFSSDDARVTGPSVAVDGRVITADRDMLVLQTHDRTRYLGYQVRQLTQIRGTRDGWLVGGGSPSRALALDARFHERRRFATPDDPSQLYLVDDRHAIVAIEASSALARSLYTTDLLRPELREFAWETTGAIVGYEPSTHLLAVKEDDAVRFAHVDPKTGMLGEPVAYRVAGSSFGYQVYLLDPARSRGNVALVLETDDAETAISVTEIGAVTDGVQVARSYDVDTAGGDPTVTAKILRDHGVTAEGRPSSRRSPDGKWLASADGARITLRGASGSAKWVVAAHGATDVAWRPDGELAAVGRGIVAIDVETGAFGARQCGWGFGFADQPRLDDLDRASLCDAP